MNRYDNLSKRLQMIADMTGGGSLLVDVGTDHGYLPIELVGSGKYACAVAADVHRGPLERASLHIREAGLSDRIATVCGDGLKPVVEMTPQKSEKQGKYTDQSEGVTADTIVIAGMGARLAEKILQDSLPYARRAGECIVSPHTDWCGFRKKITEIGFYIDEEDMVEEEGQFYVCMRLKARGESDFDIKLRGIREYTDYEWVYGASLLRAKHPVAEKYIQKQLETKRALLKKLLSLQEVSREKIQCVRDEIRMARQALGCF